MTPQQIRKLVSEAPPGSLIRVVEIQTPHDTSADTDGAPEEVVEPQDPPTPDPQPSTPLERALELHRGDPTFNASREEWAAELSGISKRELDRAVAHKVFAVEKQGEGRGNALKLISAEEMIRYLELCELVQSGAAPAPGWWRAVRLGPNGRIRNDG